jgi:Zn-dependent M28 family amino/carboxypeptidase
MKNLFIFFSITLVTVSFSQTINDYEFLVIPIKYPFQKKENQYRINTTLEVYFKQKNFNVLGISEPKLAQISNNPCQALYVDMTQKSNMFMTKLTVFVKDCNGKILLTSAEGISREKDYEMSYNEALRNALRTMPKIDYKYLGQPTNQNTISNFPEQTINQNSKLVAEKTENGFLIIDNSTSKIVLKLYKTSIENVYIVQTGNKNGIAFKQNGKLIFEFIENGKASRDEFDVTF